MTSLSYELWNKIINYSLYNISYDYKRINRIFRTIIQEKILSSKPFPSYISLNFIDLGKDLDYYLIISEDFTTIKIITPDIMSDIGEFYQRSNSNRNKVNKYVLEKNWYKIMNMLLNKYNWRFVFAKSKIKKIMSYGFHPILWNPPMIYHRPGIKMFMTYHESEWFDYDPLVIYKKGISYGITNNNNAKKCNFLVVAYIRD